MPLNVIIRGKSSSQQWKSCKRPPTQARFKLHKNNEKWFYWMKIFFLEKGERKPGKVAESARRERGKTARREFGKCWKLARLLWFSNEKREKIKWCMGWEGKSDERKPKWRGWNVKIVKVRREKLPKAGFNQTQRSRSLQVWLEGVKVSSAPKGCKSKEIFILHRRKWENGKNSQWKARFGKAEWKTAIIKVGWMCGEWDLPLSVCAEVRRENNQKGK